MNATMTAHHARKLRQLEDQIGVPHGTLPVVGNCKGYVFTQVDGVTVVVTRRSRNPNGGFIVPSLHTYTETITPTNIHAAADAKDLYEKQMQDWETATTDINMGTGVRLSTWIGRVTTPAVPAVAS